MTMIATQETGKRIGIVEREKKLMGRSRIIRDENKKGMLQGKRASSIITDLNQYSFKWPFQ